MYEPKENEKNYDFPGSSSGDLGLEEESIVDKIREPAEQAAGVAKKNWKKIAAGIAVIFVLFFLFDFFIGSVKPVSFSVNDTEGEPLTGATVKILGTDNKEIATIGTGETANLRRGNYYYSVSLSGYKPILKKSIEITEDESIVETLEKNIPAELTLSDFPPTLVPGQSFAVTATIRPTGETTEQAELVFEGALDEKTMSVSYDAPISLTSGEKTVLLSFEVKKEIEKITKGNTGTIRIRGLDNSKAKKEVNFDFVEFDPTDIKISGSTSFGTVEEGLTSPEKKITIKNSSAIDLENLEILIEVNNTQFSPKDEVPGWFGFSQSVPIERIPAGQQAEIGINVSVPAGINFDESALSENIQGQVVFRTSFFEVKKELDLVVKKNQSRLEFQGISAVSVSFDEDSGSYPTKATSFRIKNSGNLAIKNISLTEITATCNGENWVSFDKPFISQIPPNGTEQAIYILKVPSEASRPSVSICTITATFDNPRKIEPLTIEQPQTFVLNTN